MPACGCLCLAAVKDQLTALISKNILQNLWAATLTGQDCGGDVATLMLPNYRRRTKDMQGVTTTFVSLNMDRVIIADSLTWQVAAPLPSNRTADNEEDANSKCHRSVCVLLISISLGDKVPHCSLIKAPLIKLRSY